jgi:hypothetical protein
MSGALGPGVVRTSMIAPNAITEALLSAALDRQAVPHGTDVIEVEPDRWRFKSSEVALVTAIDGTGWEQFPRALTPTLRGINQSGTAIALRKSARLPIRGRRYNAAGFAPISTASINYKGFFGNGTTYATYPTTGTTAGDYYVCGYTGGTTVGALTYNIGDLAVWTGSAWVKQVCPGSTGALSAEGDWWYATAAGTFAGISLAVGDVIYCVTNRGIGGPFVPQWAKGKYATNGELFYRGAFAPSGGLPSSPANGEVYQASAAGSAGGFTFAVGDYLIYEQGARAQVATNPIQTVAAGAAVYLACGSNANEWEAQRVDQSNTRAGVVLKARTQSARRRNSDTVMLFSDSLFGVSDVGGKIANGLAPRNVATYSSWGGSTSRQVQGAVEAAILGSDPYAGNVLGIWHGQNNQPATINDANSAQIKQVAREIAALCGARDKRFFFLSIMGTNYMSWNGTRIVCNAFENDFAAGGKLLDIEQFYASAFPGQWISPRQALLAAAGSTLDARVPGTGLTEAQTAAAYGWIPMSFYNPPAGLTTAFTAFNLKGYWTDTVLPTGGSPGDCYTRSGGASTTGSGGIGNLLVNQGGTWGEYLVDITHLGPLGATALAAAVVAFINSNLW